MPTLFNDIMIFNLLPLNTLLLILEDRLQERQSTVLLHRKPNVSFKQNITFLMHLVKKIIF